jgi:hypothetical protein
MLQGKLAKSVDDLRDAHQLLDIALDSLKKPNHNTITLVRVLLKLYCEETSQHLNSIDQTIEQLNNNPSKGDAVTEGRRQELEGRRQELEGRR